MIAQKHIYEKPARLLSALQAGSIDFHGRLGKALALTVENRLKKVDYQKLVRTFREHDDIDERWRGEFWGKIVRSAIRVLSAHYDADLAEKIAKTVKDLIACIEEDGTLSSYPPEKRFGMWDTWGRKYAILGLCRYYRDVQQDPAILEAIHAVTLNFIRKYPAGQRPGDGLMYDGMPANSILGALVLVARLTGDKKILDYAIALANTGCAQSMNIFRMSIEGVRPEDLAGGKAYEMTSCFEGLLEIYCETGDRSLLELCLNYFNDMIRNEVSVIGVGGLHFESWNHGVIAQMRPDAEPALGETCVVTTMMRLGYHLLREVGSLHIAEQIENMLCNGLLGAINPDGSWWMHMNPTPLAGVSWKRPAWDQIPGYGEDCCVAQGPEGLGVAGMFAVMTNSQEALVVNYFEPMTIRHSVKGTPVTVEIRGNYPDDGDIVLEIHTVQEKEFMISLRIPEWCDNAALTVKGKKQQITTGRYVNIERRWNDGDCIHLKLSMPVRKIPAPDGSNRFAVKRGPMVLVQDSRLGEVNAPCILPNEDPIRETSPEIISVYKWSNGQCLCDYASSGNRFNEQNKICVWLPK